ncbi:unnamed protein product [Calicophoron daubneyi]|uniref:Uncharacterized protein n=1 Tax=Calicophoron daubneyi TaxID=300641 RepID=A0AAV2TVL9_CALDB
MEFARKLSPLLLSQPCRSLANSAYRSFKLFKSYEPEVFPETRPNLWRNNHLPKEYERMMQKVFNRLRPSGLGSKKLNSIVLSRRERKMSEASRLATPEGRHMMYKRLIAGRRSLWSHDW